MFFRQSGDAAAEESARNSFLIATFKMQQVPAGQPRISIASKVL
jgi:hypothetical protein